MSGGENMDLNQDAKGAPLFDEDIKIVISFDGGGIRGLMSVIIAAAIEKAAGVPLASACDLLIGTSIGGITALLFATPDAENPTMPKFKATDIEHHYHEFAKRIFSIPISRTVKTLWGFDKSKYSNYKIKKIMEEYFQDARLSQALTPTLVVGAEIERYIPILLKSYEDPDFFMKDAALATSAAPTFFPVAKIQSLPPSHDSSLSEGRNGDYYVIDGKVTGANNPALVGYAEMCYLHRDIKDIRDKVLIISIGTGKAHRTIHYDEVAEAGFLSWMPLILPLIGELANDITDYQMDLLLRDMPTPTLGPLRRYWRLQPIIPESLLMIDLYAEKKLKELVNMAKNYVLEHKREIQTIGKILAHRAKCINNKK